MSEQRPERPPRKNGNRTPSGPGGLKLGRGLFGWVVFIGLAVMLFVLLQTPSRNVPKIAYSEFESRLDQNKVQKISFESSDKINGEFNNQETIEGGQVKRFYTTLPAGSSVNGELINRILEKRRDAQVSFENSANIWLTIIGPLIPWLLIFGFIWFFVFRQLRNSAGAGGMLGNFGRSRHKITSKEHTNVTFDDVAGVEEAKDEVMEIVEFLKNPKKFQRLGGRIPRGVLLVGEPGTGKTLLAKAIAGEADVPFFSISGSDFVEMFVGVGASRVRDLFKQAKDNCPCIIFLDEIDAVGRRRGSGFSSGGHDEREQTLNAILVEMDGFDTNDQVIVVAIDQPRRRARPRPDASGSIRSAGLRAAARREGPHGHPEGPQPQGEAWTERRSAAAGPRDAGFQRRRPRRDHQRIRPRRHARRQGIHRAGRPRRSPRQGPLRPGQQEPRDGREGKAGHRLSRSRPRRRAVSAAAGCRSAFTR